MSENRLAAAWTGALLVGAPSPELFRLGDVGADTGGIATSATYHIVGKVGTFAWVATGATVKNLYGGA